MIAPQFRGKRLWELLILLSLDWAANNGYAFVNGSVRPGRRLQQRLLKLHLIDNGDVVQNLSPYGEHHSLQPLLCDLKKVGVAIKEDIRQILASQDYRF